MKRNLILILGLVLSVGFMSCDDDDPEIPLEQEVITSVELFLTPAGGGDAVTLAFNDPDGDGGIAPTVTGGTLLANTNYTGRIELLNETLDPVEDVTLEIEELDDEHQFFFISTVEGVTVDYLDEDDNGNPLGLSTSLTTGAAGSGILTVILRHLPNKSGENVSDGDITNAGGETDAQVDFPVSVQ